MDKKNFMKNISRKSRARTNSYYNKLVPELIEQSQKLTNEIKYRMKLNTFFSEFESKASNQFNYFLKESLKRYKSTRSGCNLDTIIATSRKKRLKIANEIINDNFYSKKDIVIEKEKMKRKTTNKINKTLKETISKLKGLTKSFSLYNSEKKEKDEKNILKKPIMKKKKKCQKINKKPNLLIMSNEKLDKGKDDIESLLNKEKKSLYKTMDNYKNELSVLNSIKGDSKKYSFAHKNMFLTLPKLNLLTYKKYAPKINPYDEDTLNRVDFNKLLPYSRLGKKLKYTSKYSKEKKSKNKINNAFITEPKHNYMPTKYNSYINGVKNTNEIVFSSANQEFDIESRINTKRKKLEDILGIDNIPTIESYEVIIKNIYEKKRKERIMNQNKKNVFFDIKKEEESSHSKANKKLEKRFNILNDIENRYMAYTQDLFKDKK